MSIGSTVKRSDDIPGYLEAYADNKRASITRSKKAYAEESIREDFNSGVMSREAFLQEVDHVYHGHGIREALADLSVWEESGGKIFRRQDCQREVEAILRQLNDLGDSAE